MTRKDLRCRLAWRKGELGKGRSGRLPAGAEVSLAEAFQRGVTQGVIHGEITKPLTDIFGGKGNLADVLFHCRRFVVTTEVAVIMNGLQIPQKFEVFPSFRVCSRRENAFQRPYFVPIGQF